MTTLSEAAQQALDALVSQFDGRADAIDILSAALAQQAETELTIERLRDALVASRIIDPGAVEDPDDYDDGVMFSRIEALYRRIA
jgi:hypothetical protein